MHIVSRVGIGKIPPSSPLYLDVLGAVNFDNTLSVVGQTTVNSLISSQLSANSLVYESRIQGEDNVLFSINRDGKLEWGSGGVLSPDINLYRTAANALQTNGSLIIDQSLYVGNSTSDTATFTARISSNLDPSATDTYSLGQDSLRWQNLWLSVKLTSVDGLFTGDLKVDGNAILGDNTSDTVTFNARISSSLIPSTDNSYDLGSSGLKWGSLWLGSNLQVDGNTILGDNAANTLALNARVSTSVVPVLTNSYDLGSSGLKWGSLWLGSNLQVDGNTALGDSSADLIYFTARAASSLIPSTDNSYDLGSLGLRWGSLWLGSNLQVDGNTILGDSSSDIVTVNAGFASPLNPFVDNFYDLGTFDYRWKQIHLGPNGIVVRNDNINSDKVSLCFNAGVATLQSSVAIPLKLTTGSNNGITIDISGNIGINSNNVLTHNFSVFGNSILTDTAWFSKATGSSLIVESIVGVKGSIESANDSKILNLGVSSDTEFVNIGSNSETKTINIGTGSGKTTINIGGPLDIINMSGTVSVASTIESTVKDKSFTLNVGGANNTAQNSGLFVQESDAVLLQVTDPTWQIQNIVRYSTINTGNIIAGSLVTISGFVNALNNGQFVVTNVSTNSYIEVNNLNVFNNSVDEIGLGVCTNPLEVASISLDSDRISWKLTSPNYYSNYFKISNNGANVELLASSSGLFVNANALLPNTPFVSLGSSAYPWNAYINDLVVYENSTLGNPLTLTSLLNIYSLTSFNNYVTSNIIPDTDHDLGSISYQWNNLYSKNVFSYNSLFADGSIYLGSTVTTTISAGGSFVSDLIPQASVYSLGSVSKPWEAVYANKYIFPSLNAGSVVFVNNDKTLTDNNIKFFWNNEHLRLFLGQNVGNYVLDISKSGTDSIKIGNSENSSAISLRTKETLFSSTGLITNGPQALETTNLPFSATVGSIAQTFVLSASKKIKKIGLQLATTAPLLAPSFFGTMKIFLHSVTGGVISPMPIASSLPLILDTFPYGFQSNFTDFVFPEIQILAPGTYAISVKIFETYGIPGAYEGHLIGPSTVPTEACIRLITNDDSSYTDGTAYVYDSILGWQLPPSSQDLCFKIYEEVATGSSVSNKFEFTDVLQFGSDTYSNVGNGASTAILELSSTAIKLLGAVSVNSAAISSTTYTVQPTDVIMNIDTSVSGCTITLPSAATKRLLVIKDIGNNASVAGRSIQISPASNQYVEFNAINTPYVLDRDGESITLQSDGVNRWYII